MTYPLSDMQRSLPMLALCRQYLGAQFGNQSVQVLATTSFPWNLTVSWASGLLSDGDWEMLGEWPSFAEDAQWLRMFVEFIARGMEKWTPFVVVDASQDVQLAFPGSAALPSFGQVLNRRFAHGTSQAGQLGSAARRAVREASSARMAGAALAHLLSGVGGAGSIVLVQDRSEVLAQLQTYYALSPRRGALFRRGDEVVEHHGRTLSRAVLRHVPFADSYAATSFVASTLSRAERRPLFSELTRPSLRPRRAVNFANTAQGA